MKNQKIYDCFTFFNELDLLELRLEILNKYVDKFVLVEMNKTHSGEDKPFYFEENKERYKKYLDKIIHIKVADCPRLNPIYTHSLFLKKMYLFKPFRVLINRFDLGKWKLENFQRNKIATGLPNCSKEDIILISDLDEIPNPSTFSKIKKILLKEPLKRIALGQKWFIGYLNGLIKLDWIGTKAVSYLGLIKKWKSPQKIRLRKDNLFRKINNSDCIFLNNGGWHFSYMGGKEKQQEKINSFAELEKIKINEIFYEFAGKKEKIKYINPNSKILPKEIKQKKYVHLINFSPF